MSRPLGRRQPDRLVRRARLVALAQLGHADPAITGRIYAHLTDERDLDLAAAAFECRHEGRRAVGLVEELVEEPRSES